MSKFKVGDEVTSSSDGGRGWITMDAGAASGMQRWFVSWRDPVQRTGRIGWLEEDLVLLSPDEVGHSPLPNPCPPPSAFPVRGYPLASGGTVSMPGLTKREWFAGQALSMLERPVDYVGENETAASYARTARRARRMADALLAELAKT